MIRRSRTRDWSSLAPDLIPIVGDLLLDTSDVDGYMNMRAVCRDWRSALADHAGLLDAADPRFFPRQWVMLDNEDIFNVSTGHFFRRRLPLLRSGHALVGASDGLLVLADSRYPHPCRVLNPLTGHTLRFAAPIPVLSDTGTVAVEAGSDVPVLLLESTRAMCGRPKAMIADPARKYFCSRITRDSNHFAAAVAYAGHIYMACTNGSVFRRVGAVHQDLKEPIIAAGNPADEPEAVFLVESAGELLLVLRHRERCIFRVFRVDVEQKVLQPVATSIGGRTLFLGRRCLSVAADKFPNIIQGDCLYYATSLFDRRGHEVQCMYKFRMRDGREELVSSNMNPMWFRPESLPAYISPFHYGREDLCRVPESLSCAVCRAHGKE